MARTKADAYTKAAVKAPRKASVLSGGQNSSGSKSGGVKAPKYSGGNPYCPRPTPSWQKPITSFFDKGHSPDRDDDKEPKKRKIDDVNENGKCSSSAASSTATSASMLEDVEATLNEEEKLESGQSAGSPANVTDFLKVELAEDESTADVKPAVNNEVDEDSGSSEDLEVAKVKDDAE